MGIAFHAVTLVRVCDWFAPWYLLGFTSTSRVLWPVSHVLKRAGPVRTLIRIEDLFCLSVFYFGNHLLVLLDIVDVSKQSRAVIMGALDLIRNRDARTAQTVVGTDEYHFRDEKHHHANDFEVHAWGPSTETRSNAALRHNSREGVTEEAQRGVQKAEAVALVWSKKAAFGTYAL